jgi:hypothetical protein
MADFNQFLQQVIDYYGDAGKTGAKSVTFQDDGSGGVLGTARGNQVNLNPALLEKLKALYAAPRNKDAARQGIEALGTLIHESLHTRGPYGDGTRQSDGFFPWDDEWQAHQLSYNLVPDAMQRFFGVDPNSKLGAFYYALAKGRGYGGDFGDPEAAGAQGNLLPRRFNL